MERISFEKFEIDEENRAITFSCASDLPYERYDYENDRAYKEILVISEEAVDLHRLNGGASLLWGHDTDDLIGVVDNAYIVENKLFVNVRFSKNDKRADRIWKDILDGLIKNVSVGYAVEHFIEKEVDNELVRYVDRWMPYEVSIVSVPADETVGIRSMKKKTTREAVKPEDPDKMETENKQECPDCPKEEKGDCGVEAENEALKAENEALKAKIKELEEQAVDDEANNEENAPENAPETSQENPPENAPAEQPENPDAGEIKACGDEMGVPKEEQEKAIKAGITARDFKSKYRNFNINITTKKERSIMKLADYLREGNFNEKFTVRTFTGFGGQTSEGGAPLIGTETQPLEAALEKVIGVKGYRTIAGLTSNISIPVQTTRNVAYQTTHLRDAATTSNPAFTNVMLTPVKISGNTRIGKELIAQVNDDVEAFIIDSLIKEIGYKVEDYMLGKVASGATGSVTYSALTAIDWADILAFEASIGGYALEEPAYVMSPAARAALKGIAKAGTFPVFLCEDNRVNGYNVNVSGCVGNDNIYFGDWSKLLLGIWGNGLEIMVNPYTYAKEGDVEIVASICIDAAALQGDAFVVGSVASSTEGDGH